MMKFGFATMKDLAGFVARTKAQPTAWNYATTGRGPVNTLVPE